MNQTTIIPEIIEEPALHGCAPGNETLGYFAGEISRLRSRVAELEQDNAAQRAVIAEQDAAIDFLKDQQNSQTYRENQCTE